MIRSRVFLAGSAVAAVVSTSSLARAADYYFDSAGGDDSKDGTTESTAKKTFKMPSGSGNTIHLKRGSSFSGNLNATNVTVVAYGCGVRPTFNGSISVNKSTVEGLRALPTSGVGIQIQSDSTVRDCESEGTAFVPTASNAAGAMGITVMGTNNKIFGNYIHDWGASQSGASMNNSGGAEGIMVMASNNEIAFNSVVNCVSPNQQLGGLEGGCYEIVNGKAGSVISDVSFHHNYCERSVGMWEASSGDFSSNGGHIQENHGIVQNVTISYNISVDAMWMYLLQPVNTDFKNLVFSHNTIIHTPKTKEYFTYPKSTDFPNGLVYTDGGHAMMGIGVDKDTVTDPNTGTTTTYTTNNDFYKMDTGFAPGTVIVKDNIFADMVESGVANSMFILKVADHSNNIFIPKNANLGVFTLGSTEKKVDIADMAFTSDYQLTAASTPAIDQGVAIDMTTNGSVASTTASTTIFATTFNQDVARQSVPCGDLPDIGASEFCTGATALAWPTASDANSCGAGGSPGTGGNSAIAAGGTGNVVVGGSGNVGVGGAKTSTGGAAVGIGGKSGVGGKVATGGVAIVGAGGSNVTAIGGASVVANAGGKTSGVGGAQPTVTGGTPGAAGAGATSATNMGGQALAEIGGANSANSTAMANVGGAEASTVQNGASVQDGGCSCRTAGSHRSGIGAALASIGLAAMTLGRRRRTRGTRARPASVSGV